MKQRNFIFASLGHMVFFMSLSCFFTSCQIYYKACAGLSSVNKIHPGDCFSRGEMHMMNQEIFKSEYLKSKIHATMYPFYLSDIQSSCVGLYYYEGFSEENFRFP
ncbi:MAG: hypothetical protein SF053_21800, partial [Bacteroidia bacterium]|nr:hypothetical protein [Bacteroidia bacterium]